jgi:hypothetical protein
VFKKQLFVVIVLFGLFFFGESSRPSFFVLVGHNFLISNPFSLTTVSVSDVQRGGVQQRKLPWLAGWMCMRLAGWITTHPSGKKWKKKKISSILIKAYAHCT